MPIESRAMYLDGLGGLQVTPTSGVLCGGGLRRWWSNIINGGWLVGFTEFRAIGVVMRFTMMDPQVRTLTIQ